MPFAAGTRLGAYEIVGTIGAGGMGMIYRARHVETGEPVALKSVLVSRSSQLAGLRREIHALMQIRHPGVARFLAEGVLDGQPWYAMELLEGRTLSAAIRSGPALGAATRLETVASADSTRTPAAGSTTTREGSTATPSPVADAESPCAAMPYGAPAAVPSRPVVRLRPRTWESTVELLGVIQQLCGALSFIHERGIVHRDLKPSNVLIRPDGAPVLMDFGLSSRFAGLRGREHVEPQGDRRGTPAYMAPELLRGAPIDARADLYSLGCILYEIATGERLFADAASDADYVRSHLRRPPPPPCELAPMPSALNHLILRLLAKDPRERLGHADDVAVAIAQLRGVAVDRAVAAGGGYLYRSRLAGRERMMTELEDRLDAAAGGRGGCVMLGGESGIGKTSLAAGATRFAGDHGFLVVTGECEPPVTPHGEAAGGAPLHPFRPLLQTIADYCVERGAPAARRILGDHALVLAPYEPRLSDLPGVDRQQAPAELPPEGALERLFAALAGTIVNFTHESALLLILEDLHWADDLSLRFLQQLPESYFGNLRLLLLGTYRTEEAGAGLRRMLEGSGVAAMRLGRLDEPALDAIVADMLALPSAPPVILQFLVRHCDGNPFFAAEYLRAAVAEGFLYRQAGRWHVDDPARTADLQGRIVLPSSLRDLVSRRLDRIDPGARPLVDAAAALGREFDGDLLQAMTGAADAEVFQALNHLLDRQILGLSHENRFVFMHHQIRDVAYERIEDDRRRMLHRAAATAIESKFGGDADFPQRFIALARHWEGAGEMPQAVHYLDKAGEHALRTSAYGDAVRLLGRGAELSAAHLDGDAVRDAHRQLALGEAWLGLDDYANGRRHLGRAVAALGFPMPEGKWRRVLGLCAEIGRQAVPHLRARGRRPEVSERSDIAARAYAHMQIAWRYTADPALVLIYAALRAINLGEHGASPENAAMAFSHGVVYAATIPLHAAARRYERMALDALARTTDRNAHSFAGVALAVYHAGIGDWERAAAAAHESARIALEVGFRRRREDALSIAGFIEAMRWRPAHAARLYDEVNESGRRGNQRARIWALGALGVIALRLNDRRGAEARLRDFQALRPGELDPADRMQLDAAAGLIAAHLDDPHARTALDRALDALERTPPVLIESIDPCARLAEGYVVLLRKALTAGGAEAAEIAAQIRRTCAYGRRLAKRFPVVVADERYWRAESASLLGHPRQAVRAWQESLAAGERYAMGYHEWRAHGALAAHAADSAAREYHHQRAAALAATVLDRQRGADAGRESGGSGDGPARRGIGS